MIKINNLYKSFGDKIVYSDFSLNFESGEISAVLGPSGCGKTTLLNIIAGLDNDYRGEVVLSGETERLAAADGRKKIRAAYVFNEPRLIPSLTALENLTFIGADEKTAADMLQKVGVPTGLYPYELSAGMAQRVNLARAFTASTDVILLDEPFKSLDYGLKLKLLELTKTLANQRDPRPTVIAVTHDPEEAALIASRAVVLSCGKVVRDFPVGFTETELRNVLKEL